MAHQSNRNLKTRVSRLSRRVNKTSRDLTSLATEVGQALQTTKMQTLSSIGLTDLLVTVLERTQPGLAQAMKDLAKERSEAKPVDDKPGVVTEPGQAGDAAQT